MRTYVKIEGKEVEPVVQKLAKLAVDSPEICVMDVNILDEYSRGISSRSGESGVDRLWAQNYFDFGDDILDKECARIISKSVGDLGDANIYFEWLTPPNDEELRSLRSKIDGVLKPLGYKYTVTNRK